jgi:DNA primase
MRFTDSFLDEIRARLPVSQVAGRRVNLKRRGREFVGLSPFNKEKTPSFTVNDSKGFYHCFSSGNHGDIFRFVMETEGLSFPEAVERLAGEAGMPMPKPDPQYEKAEKERLTLIDSMEAAASLFEKQFVQSDGRHARNYAKGRGLTDKTIQAYRIGYAPSSRDFLKNALIGKGFTEVQLLEAGLLIKPDDGRASYDRFRNRLMIPIPDSRGRVIAFGARTLEEGGQPKYLNSPETKLFDKGSSVFNFARARGPAHEKQEIIVVEGYMDAIALDQAGFPNVVATLGTAFTERQMQLLWQLAPEPVICFDGDQAGEGAAARAIDRMLPALKEGHSFRFAFLPEGNDPDDLVKAEGPEAFAACLANAKPLIEIVWHREISAQPLDTPERKAALEARLERLLESIGNGRVREHYRREIKSRLAQLWEAQRPQSPRFNDRPAPRGKAPARTGFGRSPRALPDQVRRIRDLPTSPRGFAITIILSLLNHPWLLERFGEEIAALELRAAPFAALLDELAEIILSEPEVTPDGLADALRDSRHAKLFDRIAKESAFSRISFLQPDTPDEEVEEQFRDLLFRWRALPTLKKELLEIAPYLSEGSDAEFDQFVMLQEQVANDGIAEAHEDAGDREAKERLAETIARVRRERIGLKRGRRP